MRYTAEEVRAQFEEAFSKPPYEWEFPRYGEHSAWPGNYQNYDIQCAWEGYQAAYAGLLAGVAGGGSGDIANGRRTGGNAGYRAVTSTGEFSGVGVGGTGGEWIAAGGNAGMRAEPAQPADSGRVTDERLNSESAEDIAQWLYTSGHRDAAATVRNQLDVRNARIRDLEAALAAQSQPAERVPEEWQPIETAPRDGAEVLLRSLKGKHADGFWEPKAYDGAGCWVWPYVYCEPAYWMPIPTPPNP